MPFKDIDSAFSLSFRFLFFKVKIFYTISAEGDLDPREKEPFGAYEHFFIYNNRWITEYRPDQIKREAKKYAWGGWAIM